ncbi:hypothetical protein [Nocardia farcinica]|uniref:hypothetical protein n=1 Tax=Nocardia farcinica TaxID=37329 RepID=UPI002457C00A|nr:hypothetical protein [Nocardia farcinica]
MESTSTRFSLPCRVPFSIADMRLRACSAVRGRAVVGAAGALAVIGWVAAGDWRRRRGSAGRAPGAARAAG